MGTRTGGRKGRPGIRRRVALWYVLASSYAVAWLFSSRAVSGVWDFDARFVAYMIGVTLVQLGALEFLSWRRSGEAPRALPDGVDSPEPPP